MGSQNQSVVERKAPSHLQVFGNREASVEDRVAAAGELMRANRDKIAAGLQRGMDADLCISTACQCLIDNAMLLSCNIVSILRVVRQAGTYGWLIDGVMGQASMVPFWDHKQDGYVAKLIPGYKGMRQLVDRADECVTMMQPVYAADTWEYKGPMQEPVFIPSDDDDREDWQNFERAFVLAKYKGTGEVKCFQWPKNKCIRHRDRFARGYTRTLTKAQDACAAAKAKFEEVLQFITGLYHKGKLDEYRSPRNPRGNAEYRVKLLVENPWFEQNSSFPVMCQKSVMLEGCHRGELPMSLVDKRGMSAIEKAQVVQPAQITPAGVLEELPDADKPALEHGEATQPGEVGDDELTPEERAEMKRLNAEAEAAASQDGEREPGSDDQGLQQPDAPEASQEPQKGDLFEAQSTAGSPVMANLYKALAKRRSQAGLDGWINGHAKAFMEQSNVPVDEQEKFLAKARATREQLPEKASERSG